MAIVASNRPGLLISPGFIFVLILAAALVLRLVLALTYPHFWGVDGGASGITVNYWTGQVDYQAGFPKPPLAPGFLLAPFWLLLGPDVGYKVWSALFACLPLIPVFLLTRKYVGEWAAVFAIAFAAIDWMWGEMFVTGAHPLVAFALLGIAFWAMGELLEEFSIKKGLVLAVSIGLVPWVNQTTAGLALIVLPVFYISLTWFLFRQYLTTGSSAALVNVILQILPFAFLGGLIALGALPWYMQTLPGSSILTYQGPILYWAWGVNTFQAFALALPLGLFVIWKSDHAMLKALAVILLVLGFLVNWMSFDEVLINPPYRSRYLMALVFYPLATWVVWKYCLPWFNVKLAYALGVAAFIYFGSVFVYVVRLQNEYSLMVTQDTAGALAMLRATDPQAGIASNSFTLSLWVSALNKVHSPFAFTAPPPPAYVHDDEHLRCLYNWVPGCDPGAAAKELGVKYLLIEERFPFYNDRAPGNYLAPPDQWERTAAAEWLELVYERGTTKLWRIEPDTEPTAEPSATTTRPRT